MNYANIILEILDRIKVLEQEVAALKSRQNDAEPIFRQANIAATNDLPYGSNYYSMRQSKRDTTRYLFEGYVYAKNRLVLAVVKSFVSKAGSITRQQLKQVFPKSLQGSIGVVENVEIARISRSDYNVRFFTRAEDIIHLQDGDMYVCTQWGIGNIPNFVDYVKDKKSGLGLEIEEIK